MYRLFIFIVTLASLGTCSVFTTWASAARSVEVQEELWARRYDQAIEAAKAAIAEVEGVEENTAESLRLRLHIAKAKIELLDFEEALVDLHRVEKVANQLPADD